MTLSEPASPSDVLSDVEGVCAGRVLGSLDGHLVDLCAWPADDLDEVERALDAAIGPRPSHVRSIPPPAARPGQHVKILFLASNPVTMTALRLNQEVRQIQEKISASRGRDTIEFIVKLAVRPDDLQQVLLDVEPHIVHFSGHGAEKEGLALESPEGISAPVDKEALVHLLCTLKDNIRLVIFNACQTRSLAEAITSHIDCAIGTRMEIGDDAAIEFSAAFYRAIASGRSVKVAFDLGCSAVRLKQIAETEDGTPKLYVRSGIDPGEIIFQEDNDAARDPKGPMPAKLSGKTRGLDIELGWLDLGAKLIVASVLIACSVIAALFWIGAAARRRSRRFKRRRKGWR